MDDLDDCPRCGKHEKREALSILREMWRNTDSPLRRIYSSWEELEQHMEIATRQIEKSRSTHAQIVGRSKKLRLH
jgi:hypothetical protein